MGLTLVLFGVILLVGGVGAGQRVLPFVSKWWAVVPMLLGVEILAAGFLSGATTPPIKYDLFGIIVVFFVVVVSIGLHGLTVGGVIPAAQRSFGSMEYPVELAGETIPLGDAIRRIVVASDCVGIDIRTCAEPQVTYFGRGRMSAVSQEEASMWAAQARGVTRREGDTLFISFEPAPVPRTFGGHSNLLRWTLLIPANADLEFTGSARANVAVTGLAADWSVKTANAVSVRLGRGENIRLQVRVSSVDDLSGAGVPWRDETALVPVPAGQGGEAAPHGPVTKTAVFGQGLHSLHVQSPINVDIEM